MYTKVVYVCSPLKGELQENITKAIQYCRQTKELGYIPYAPHVLFTTFMDDNDPKERIIAMHMGLEMLKKCDELWVFGSQITEGMAREILRAKELGIPVYYKNSRILDLRIKMKTLCNAAWKRNKKPVSNIKNRIQVLLFKK